MSFTLQIVIQKCHVVFVQDSQQQKAFFKLMGYGQIDNFNSKLLYNTQLQSSYTIVPTAMLHQSSQVQDEVGPEETFNHQAQTIIASTIRQIDQLSDVVISELASEFENKLMADFTTQKSQIFHQGTRKEEEILQTTIQQTLSVLLQVKFHLTLLLELYFKDKSNNEVIKEIEDDIRKFRKSIMLLESQMSMILWIKENKRKPHFRERYFEKFSELQQFSIQLENLKDGFINSKMVVEALETVEQILHQYIDSIIELKEYIQRKKRSKYLLRGLNRLCVINTKVLTISEVLPFCCTVSKDDLFCFDIDHPRWQKLISECIVYRSFSSKEDLKESFDNLKKNLNLVNATMGIFDKTRKLPLLNFKSWLQIARSSKYLMKLFLFKDAAKKEAEYMICSANAELMKEVWNLPEHKVFRDIAEFLLPSIEHSERLYIPRIALDYFNSNGKNFPNMTIPYLNQYGNEMFKKKNYEKSLRIRINSKFKLTPKFKIIDQKTKKSSQGTGLIVENIGKALLTISSLCSDKPKYVPDKLVFHVHGGGFISMSSFIHQIYVRAWTKQLQIPFISVDYGKAPEHPYPQSLYDCLQAYLWTLHCFEQLYEAQPKKIILLGDSAGGNLIAALVNLCIAWKLRVPDGLVMCYPVLKVNSKSYTRSLLGTLEDMILPHTMLKLCALSYAPNLQREDDPLVSPLQTPNQFLCQFPETRIFVGSKDPFHDDCCRFTEKMNSVAPGKCLLTIYEEFPHGFLQFDLKTNPNEFGRQANAQICKTIGQMFKRLDQKEKQHARH